MTDKTDYKYKITSTFRMSYPEHVENSWPVHGGDTIFYAGNPTGLAKWDNPNEYAGSTLQQLLEKTASDLDDAEEGLIIARDLTPGDGIGGHSISGQKYWALSLDEFNQIDNADIISFGMDALCWLRTPYINTIAYCGGENGAVNDISIKKYLGVRFAFNLDLSSVIFTSAASGGKSAATVSNGFRAVTAPTGPIKFTMEDAGRSNFTAVTTAADGNTLTISYTGATVGTNEYISAMITNGTGITHYAKLASPSGTSGTVELTLPAVFNAATDSVYIFSEQCNSDRNTDFSSKLKPVSLIPAKFSYGANAVAVNGVTASVAFSPEGPQLAGTSVTATVTLTEKAAKAGTHTFNLSSEQAGLTGSAQKITVTAGQDTFAGQTKYTFTVPAVDAADMKLTHTFEPEPVAVTGVIVFPSAAKIYYNGTQAQKAVQLFAGILPGDATNKSVTWSVTAGSGVVSVDENGLVTALGAGTAVVTATANDGSGKSAHCTVTADKIYSIISGDKSVYVRQTEGDITIVCDGTFGADGNYLGAYIDNLDCPLTPKMGTVQQGSTRITLFSSYLDTLSAGVHTLNLIYDDGIATALFMVLDLNSNDQNDGAPGAPNTGDSENLPLFAAVMLTSCAAGLIIYAKRKKTK